MQTARSTLKLKMPLPTILPRLPQQQVVVIDANALQQKTSNSKLARSVTPDAQHNKNPKAQTLTPEQQEALKVKLAKLKAEYKHILGFLQAKYPLCFSIPAKPLAIGLHKEIITTEVDNFSTKQIRKFFQRYCSDKRYQRLLVEGAQRFNLDGSAATLVTQEEVPPKTSKDHQIL